MTRTYSNAVARWAGVGPYYAMFPVEFSDQVVATYTRPGDAVLDPFSGRGTAAFSASSQDREPIGVELNPVGYVYARAKIGPASHDDVLNRIRELNSMGGEYADEARRLPRFFHSCYCRTVRRFLCAARAELRWRSRDVDRTAAAIILIYLHGKLGSALSNQMRQTKAMSPSYALCWWAERGLKPPELDPVEFFERRLRWRYRYGVPKGPRGRVYLGDSRRVLGRVAQMVEAGNIEKPRLLFTSPPYQGITNYHYDQWLRLWLLGGPPNALLNGNGRRGKYEDRSQYRSLLDSVFSKAAGLLAEDATVYVRTDRRDFTRSTTKEVLLDHFPEKRLQQLVRPLRGSSQTALFGESNSPREGRGEVDFVLHAI